MTPTPKTEQKNNVEAFKSGVRSTAPAKGWQFLDDKSRPEGVDDIDYAGVEVHTHDGGLSVSEDEIQGMRVPEGDLSLTEVFSKMAGVPASSLKRDVPGNAADYYHEIGQHEGGHLHHHDGSFDGGLKDEIRGDIAAYDGDNPEIEEALRDSRKISALFNPSHATSPALPEKPGAEAPNVNTLKLHAAAQQFQDMVVADLMSKGKLESAGDLKKLHESRPEIVRDSVQSLKDGGAFDNDDTSVSRYVQQYAKDYLEATDRWVKTEKEPERESSVRNPSNQMNAPAP